MKHKNSILIILFLAILFTVPALSLASPDRPNSDLERRPLAQLTGYQAYLDTHYGADFADYLAYLETCLLDQFPLRDQLRSLDAAVRVYGLRQRDINLYYKVKGHLGKLDPILQEKTIERALTLFDKASRETFNQEGKHLFALIPDKNVYMAEEGSYPHYAYSRILDLVSSRLSDRTGLLSLEGILELDDYYRTDPHWDQTKLEYPASTILEALGLDLCGPDTYRETEGLAGYLGTFAGQAALPVQSDRLAWLSGPVLDGLTLLDPVSGEKTGIYQTDKLQGMDPYDIFMGGAKPLLVIDNPAQAEGRELVVFRDSFGSSLIPLLAAHYQRVIVVDLRYIAMDAVKDLVDINPWADVLHLYSTSVLNSPGAFPG